MSQKKFWDNKESPHKNKLYEFSDLDEEVQADIWCKVYDAIFKKLSSDKSLDDNEKVTSEAEGVADGIINNIDALTLDAWKNLEITI